MTARRDVAVYTVGPGSAEAARSLGFTDIVSADGDVDALAALVRARLPTGPGVLLQPAGSVLAGDLAGQLTRSGYSVQKVTLYDAVAVDALSDALCDEFRTQGFAIATFFSPRTARSFVRLMQRHDLHTVCAQAGAVVLSAAVAQALAGTEWRFVRVAPQPDQPTFLRVLAECLPAPTPAATDG
jgi:uroporphyrinogen-III synthase